MEIKRFAEDFSVCKVNDFSEVNFTDSFLFIGKTEEELSVVCLTQAAPTNTIAREDGWKAMRIQGELDFSLVGILSKISTILADHKIGIFAISTYNTDYILVKEKDYDKALMVLGNGGYRIVS